MTFRTFIGVFCVAALTGAVLTGILFPTLGNNPPVHVNLLAWVVYGLLFAGAIWGLVGEWKQ